MSLASEIADSESSAMPSSLASHLEQVEVEIAAACRAANRPRSEVELIAVSKVHPASAIQEALGLGLKTFGENRVQEFATKSLQLGDLRKEIRAHLIGHLQSNKSAKAVETFDAIDSLDSLRLAERINEAAAAAGKIMPVLIEIKLSHEETKEGLEPDSPELAELLERLPSLNNLETQGLMTIAPFGEPDEQTRKCFRQLWTMRELIAQAHPRLNLPVLSMGMSGDFPIAIEEGATRIRIGTALFGARQKSLPDL